MKQDIRHNSEQAVTSSARILESLQHPVLVLDAAGELIYANATAAGSFGGWIVGLSLRTSFPTIFARQQQLISQRRYG